MGDEFAFLLSTFSYYMHIACDFH